MRRFQNMTLCVAIGAIILGFLAFGCAPVLDDCDVDSEYLLPYGEGVASWVGQGSFGFLSHGDSYAIDFMMPVGTPIAAARSGVVVAFDDAHTENCWPTGGCPWNFISIQHGDGTTAVYGHLDTDSVRVTTGQQVSRGDIIAFSGHTGFSFAPHVHFEVHGSGGGQFGPSSDETIEVHFADVCPDGIPQPLRVYVSQNGSSGDGGW